MGKIIEIKGLTFSYGDSIIFDDLTFSIPEKSFYTILGKTGCGKSTLARILMGLEDVHDFIKICNLYLNPKNLEEIKKYTKILYENPESEFITDSVMEEILFSLQSLDSTKKIKKEQIEKFAKEFSITQLLSRNPHQLSSGEKQIVALIVALVTKPRLLILDEALSMVDRVTKNNIWKGIKKYQEKNNMTILHFTDDVEDILVGTDVMILSDGKIILQEQLEKSLQFEKKFTSSQIDLPFLADLSNKLRYYDVVPSVSTDLDKLVDTIWK